MKFATVFPGQGSQSPGMLKSLAEEFSEVRDTYAEASDVLERDLWQLVQDGPREQLDRTVVTQPAMLAAGVATYRCWQKAGGGPPQQMAGHSLGEYSALVWSGALEFADAVALVKQRAELMQQAVPDGRGAMAAILGLDDDTVATVCEAAANGQIVSPVNFNAPGQVVIAGERQAVERAIVGAKAAGSRRAILLRVSVPSHSELMRPAAGILAESLSKCRFADVNIPVLSSTDVTTYSTASEIREGLRRQVYSPVRWTETARELVKNGADVIVECGPGRVLTGLMKRIDRSVSSICIDSPKTLQDALLLVDQR